MTYTQAIDYLLCLGQFEEKAGLANTQRLAAALGNSQNRLRLIHVAGTNGKGSTCAMLEAAYRAAGLRTGLYTSPHLECFRERILVRREMISEESVARLTAKLAATINRWPKERQPTFFEAVTVLALLYFTEQQCDLVVWETGLGGRLDATNIVTPLASVITNVALDHQQWLGNTVAAIAAEKAGIIKTHIPVVSGAMDPAAVAVIRSVAKRVGAPLHECDPERAEELLRGLSRKAGHKSSQAKLALFGQHQRQNAGLVLETIGILQGHLSCPPDAAAAGLANVQWPARFEILRPSATGRTGLVIVDGAHNQAGAAALKEALIQFRQPKQHWTLILGMVADKDCRAFCEVLAPSAAKIMTVPVSSERRMRASELAAICRRVAPAIAVRSQRTLKSALAASAGDALVVVAGSLYLAGETLALLRRHRSVPATDKALNEWTKRG